MAGSANHPNHRNEEEQTEENEEELETKKSQQQQKRLCDFCGESKALIYCRADSAKLCFNCDREVHSTNPLFTKHSRSQLCDLCDSNPASIHCSSENLVLCQNCDWDSHGQSSSSVHDRRPLEGFTGCPSAIELSSFLGVEDVGDKSVFGCGGGDGCLVGSGFYEPTMGVDGLSDFLVWETPSIVSLDDLIVSNDSSQNFQAMGIPPLPKNRNTACGKHKEEILFQLRYMVKLENNLKIDHEDIESLLGFQFLEPEQNPQLGHIGTGFERDAEPISFPSHEGSAIQWQGDYGEAPNPPPFHSTLLGSSEESFLVLEKPDNGGSRGTYANGDQEKQSHHPITSETFPFLPKVARPEVTSQDRDSMISRYKEKRKTRRYDKLIRYESRKARAESRIRIKGRFAKIDR